MSRTSNEREYDNPCDNRLRSENSEANETRASASWRSGYAADCKSVYASSILALASNILWFSPQFS